MDLRLFLSIEGRFPLIFWFEHLRLSSIHSFRLEYHKIIKYDKNPNMFCPIIILVVVLDDFYSILNGSLNKFAFDFSFNCLSV